MPAGLMAVPALTATTEAVVTASAPAIVSHRPMTLLTTPTSADAKPTPLSRKGVISAPAKASPSLYSTISPRMAPAPGWLK